VGCNHLGGVEEFQRHIHLEQQGENLQNLSHPLHQGHQGSVTAVRKENRNRPLDCQ
jgi:hypothetical protein